VAGDIVDLAGALWNLSDLQQIVERLLNGELPQIELTIPRQAAQNQSSSPRATKWPKCNLEELDVIVRSGPHLYDIWEGSPCRF